MTPGERLLLHLQVLFYYLLSLALFVAGASLILRALLFLLHDPFHWHRTWPLVWGASLMAVSSWLVREARYFHYRAHRRLYPRPDYGWREPPWRRRRRPYWW